MFSKDFYSKKGGYRGSINIGSLGMSEKDQIFSFDWYFGEHSVCFFVVRDFSHEFFLRFSPFRLSVSFGPFLLGIS